MKSFMQAVTLAALASLTSAAKVCSQGDTVAPYPAGDCGMPEWALAITGDALTAFDRHIVTTTDGYELTLIRIRKGSSSSLDDDEVGSNGPVLLHHGLYADGLAWLARDLNSPFDIGEPNYLPETLFENKYDVWIANARGTFYSRGHATLNPDENDPAILDGAAEYWNFGIDEAALIDIPAMINEILITR